VYKPLLVQRGSGRVLVGNNTLIAARELGLRQVDVIYKDVDDESARRIMLVDNKTSDVAEYDERLLYEALMDGDLAGTGYSDADVEALMAAVGDADDGMQLQLELEEFLPGGEDVLVLEDVSTGADWAELPQQEAARGERQAAQVTSGIRGVREIMLVYPTADHAEMIRLLDGLKARVGGDARYPQIVQALVRRAAREAGLVSLGMLVSSLYDDYLRFHWIQMSNRDVDPVYPVLRRIGDLLEWTMEERVRSVFLHVAYYDLGSALASVDRQYRAFLTAFRAPRPGLKCGSERRRHRMGDNLAVHLDHLEHIADDHGGLSWWVRRELDEDHIGNWQRVAENLTGVRGNGRWAAFKTCEMLAEVCGLPLEAPDMGHANSSGPRKGLALVCPETDGLAGNRPEVLARLDVMSSILVLKMREAGVEASLATVETTLCDFHSLVRGRYYAGLDIDVMLEQLLAAGLSDGMMGVALRARRLSLPEAYLGELAEFRWRGPDKARKQVYRRTGEIVERG
jgi:hypothetical protein